MFCHLLVSSGPIINVLDSCSKCSSQPIASCQLSTRVAMSMMSRSVDGRSASGRSNTSGASRASKAARSVLFESAQGSDVSACAGHLRNPLSCGKTPTGSLCSWASPRMADFVPPVVSLIIQMIRFHLPEPTMKLKQGLGATSHPKGRLQAISVGSPEDSLVRSCRGFCLLVL